jgi:hypothetical protein
MLGLRYRQDNAASHACRQLLLPAAVHARSDSAAQAAIQPEQADQAIAAKHTFQLEI